MHAEEEKQIISNFCRQVVEHFANYETEQSVIDSCLKVINALKSDFGGNSDATLAQRPQQLFAYYHAAYYDSTQLQNINLAIKEIESLKARYDELDKPGIDVLYAIYKLFNKSRSKNWSAEKHGYLYSTAASLNNRLAIEILSLSSVEVVGLNVLLEKHAVDFMQSLFQEMQRTNPGARYDLTPLPDESYLSASGLYGFQYDDSSTEDLLGGDFAMVEEDGVQSHEDEQELPYRLALIEGEQQDDDLSQGSSGGEESIRDSGLEDNVQYRENITASIDDDNLSSQHSSSTSPRAPGW